MLPGLDGRGGKEHSDMEDDNYVWRWQMSYARWSVAGPFPALALFSSIRFFLKSFLFLFK